MLPSFAQEETRAIDYPKLIDITASTGIHFDHHSSPEQKFIVESMSGGVALIDYDRDGWPDIYFTNAQTVEMARAGIKARGALFHNNHDGTFTDVTDKAGVGYSLLGYGRVRRRLQQRWLARPAGHLPLAVSFSIATTATALSPM